MNHKYEWGLIVDLASKQEYIFSSNKLKHNIGASYIISDIILGNILSDHVKNYDNEQVILKNVGGGNAILFLQTKHILIQFVKEFSYTILCQYPSINLELGIVEIKEEDNLVSIRSKLNTNKNSRRSKRLLVNEVQLGIAKECPITGLPQNVRYKESYNHNSVKNKVEASAKSESYVNRTYQKLLEPKKLTFSSIVKEICKDEDKGFIAVVHVDGNKIGQLFQDITDDKEFTNTSLWLESKLSNCLEKVINEVCSLVQTDQIKDLYGDHKIELAKVNKKFVLPFRSIINAGDDITFICHGSLGIYLAERYIHYLGEAYECVVNQSTGDKLKKEGISACAGVAVVHVNHPFYKAYEMAEELCQNAKKASRIDNIPRLQYMIFKEGISGTLDNIWEREYTSGSHKFKRSAHTLNTVERSGSFYEAIKLYKELQYSAKKWPKNKLQKILKSLHFENKEFQVLLAHLKTKEGIDYPEEMKSIKRSTLLESAELMEFYPVFSIDNSQ